MKTYRLPFFTFISICSFTLAAPSFITYVADGQSAAVYSIDTNTHTAISTVHNTLSPSFGQPNGVALSPDGRFAYVADWGSEKVYYVDIATNTATQVVPSFSINGLGGIAISPDASLAYATSYFQDKVYIINTATNTSSGEVNNTFAFHGPVGVAFSLNGKSAYVITIGKDSLPGGVFCVDVSSSSVTAQVNGNFVAPTAITISPDGSTAYVADLNAKTLFFIDTTTHQATGVNYALFNTPHGVAVSPDGNTIYLADSGAQAIFYVDAKTKTVTRQISVLSANPDWATNTLAISPDGNTLYLAGGDDRNIWQVDISSGTAYLLNNTSGTAFVSPTNPATLPPLIPTSSLQGNNYHLASYLNANAPYINVVRPFVILNASFQKSALESAAPTRNTFLTYASQITQLALGRVLHDHVRQKQSFQPSHLSYLVDASSSIKTRNPSSSKTPFSSWAGGFGQYAKEKNVQQTPAFTMESGGGMIGWDYRGINSHLVGLGTAYAYTHVHEKQDAGSAHVNQADLCLYTLFPVAKWYFDIALWGGYYHAKNHRHISFPGFEATAHLKTHGWQLTPHIEIGYQQTTQSLRITPFLATDFVSCWEKGASESGASLLNMHQKSRYSSLLRSETGLRLEEIFSYESGDLSLIQQASYGYQKAFHTGTLQAFLIGSPNTFTVTTLSHGQNLGIAELKIVFSPQKKYYPYVSLNSHGEWGSKYQAYQGIAEIGVRY